MEERVQEADNLSSRIRDLEAQLAGEKDKFNRAGFSSFVMLCRINSKINKFINAHVHHSRLQDEIKRQVYTPLCMSQVQLEQLVGKLGIDVLPMSTGEDELNVNISSEEALESKETAYPVRKQLHNSVEAPQGSKSGWLRVCTNGTIIISIISITHANVKVPYFIMAANMSRGHGATVLEFKRKSLVCSNAHRAAKVENKRNDSARPSKGKQPQLPNVALKSLDPLNKLKASESNIVAPPTSMAAHADDEFVELFEEEKSPGGVGTPKAVENCLPFPLPPLPNVSENNYYQYEDDDENVDVDGLEEPFEDVDIV
ncbi:Zinc finger CCCH domain-containing protein 13 [Bienertia sinuspersici]